MRQQITVYLASDNENWLRGESKRLGIGMSGIVNMLIAELRDVKLENENDINRAFETARLADLENES